MTEPGETLRRIEAKVDKLTEKVLIMEGAELAVKVTRCEARIDTLTEKVRTLENAENRRIGARGMFEWIAKYGPALAGIAAAIGWLTLVAKGIAK